MNKRMIKALDGRDVSRQLYAEVNVDPESLDCNPEYYVADVKLLKIELTSPIAKKYSGHSLIAKDLKYLIKMMKHASSIAIGNDESNDGEVSIFLRDEIDLKADMLKTIYVAAIVTYGKCFSEAHGRRVKLNKAAVFKGADRSILRTHDDIITQRNEYVAHGGHTKYESAKIFMLLHPSIDEGLPPLLTSSAMHVYGFSQSEYDRFLKLFEYVQVKHQEMIKKLDTAVRKHEIEGKELSEFYQLYNAQ
jgi:hypothetical protein